MIKSAGKKTPTQIREELTALTLCQALYSELSFSQLLPEIRLILISKEEYTLEPQTVGRGQRNCRTMVQNSVYKVTHTT